MDIESPILQELKALSKTRALSLGQMVSQLLAEALAVQKIKDKSIPEFQWISRSMEAKVDLADKEALYSVLDGK
ncbi:MAG: hypothetical protein ACH346_06300 [Chthoniobacterales bacterium]